jgi:hypothetical protein
MNQSCFKRECLNRLGRPPSATVQTTLQWLPHFQRKSGERGAQLRLDKRDAPSRLRHRLAQFK